VIFGVFRSASSSFCSRTTDAYCSEDVEIVESSAHG